MPDSFGGIEVEDISPPATEVDEFGGIALGQEPVSEREILPPTLGEQLQTPLPLVPLSLEDWRRKMTTPVLPPTLDLKTPVALPPPSFKFPPEPYSWPWPSPAPAPEIEPVPAATTAEALTRPMPMRIAPPPVEEPTAAAMALERELVLPEAPPIEQVPPTRLEKAWTYSNPVGLLLRDFFGEKVAVQAGRELYNVGKGLPEFALGTAAGQAGLAAGTVAPLTTSLVFALDTARSLWQQLPALYRDWDRMTPLERTRAFTQAAGTAGILGMLIHGGATGHHFLARLEAEKVRAERQPPKQPGLGMLRAALADIIGRPVGVPPIRRVAPPVIPVIPAAAPTGPERLLPAVRLVPERPGQVGDVFVGQRGEVHNDIIKRYNLPATLIDQRGFIGPQGQWLTREQAATVPGVRTEVEPGRAHATDVARAQAEQPAVAPTATESEVPSAIEEIGLPRGGEREHQPVSERRLPTEASGGNRPVQSAPVSAAQAAIENRPAQAGQPRVLLSPEAEAILDAEYQTVPHEVVVGAQHLEPGEPPRSVAFTINRQTGRIVVLPQALDRWLAGIRPEERAEAVRARLAEEANHLATTPEDALAYWQSLDPVRRSMELRFYTGEWLRDAAQRKWGREFTDTQLGYEALHGAMSRLARMTRAEVIASTGAERWTLQSLDAILRVTDSLEKLLPTKGAEARRKILGQVRDNAMLARSVLTQGEPAPGGLEAEKPKRREVGIAFERLVDRSRNDVLDLLAEWTGAELSEDGTKILVFTERGGPREDFTMTRSQFFDWLYSDEAMSLSDSPEWTSKVNWARRVASNLPEPAPGGLEQPELRLPTEREPERPTAAELGALPRATTFEIGRTAFGQLYRDTETLVRAYAANPADRRLSAPSYRPWAEAMRSAFPEIKPGQLFDAWERAVYQRLLGAAPDVLAAFRRAFDLETRFGTRPVPELVREAAAAEGQRYRSELIGAIASRMIGEAVEVGRQKVVLVRKSVTLDDVNFNKTSRQPVFFDVPEAALANVTALGRLLTDDARETGVRAGWPITASKRLTALLKPDTGQVELVSTYREPARRGRPERAMVTDPEGTKSVPLSNILTRGWQPIASVLLDEPVQAFRQRFASREAWETDFGREGRLRAQEARSEAPPAVEGTELAPAGTTTGRAAVPGEFQPEPSVLAERMTPEDAGVIRQHLVSEVGRVEGIDDVRTALMAARETGNRRVLTAYAKLATDIHRRNPGLSVDDIIQRLATDVYESFSQSTTAEAFQRSLVSKTVAAPEPGARVAPRPADVRPTEPAPGGLAQRAKDELSAYKAGIVTSLRAAGVTQAVSRALDAVTNIPNNRANQMGNEVRFASVRKPPGRLARLTTPWLHGDRQILAAANVLVEAQAIRPDYTFDAGARTKIAGFKGQVAQGLGQAEQMARTGLTVRERRLGRGWQRAAQELMRELDYAELNWQNPELIETATRMKRIFDEQLALEQAAGIKLDAEPNYLPHRYDASLWDGKSVLFQRDRIRGKRFEQPRTFETYYHAISEGPFIAITRDGASLVAHRVRQGLSRIYRQGWAEGLKQIDFEGKPIAVDPTQTPRGTWVSPNFLYEIIPQRGGGPPLAILSDFVPLIKDLTGESAIQTRGFTRGALILSQRLKHTLLIGDFFHLGRMVYYGLSIMGRKAGWNRGWSILDIAERDVPEAVRKGIINQRTADWANEPVTYTTPTGGRRQVTRRQLSRIFETTGLNVGRIQDALYKELVTRLTPSSGPFARFAVKVLDPSVGRYNRFLFDRLSRGLMMEGAIREFERQSKARPDIPARFLIRDISRDINNYFGNIGRQGWIKSATMQDIARIFWLAPQWVEGLIKKEAIGAARLTAASRIPELVGFEGRSQVTHLGAMGRGIGIGLGFMLALTQAVNVITRRKPTWQNEEKGHKLDAWIPGWGADSEGFWLSPLAIFNEITHDLYRYGETAKKNWDAINTVAGNKASPITRALLVARESIRPGTREYITTSLGVAGAGIQQLAPLPITFGRYLQLAGHAVAPGLVRPVPPNALQRQFFATGGIKIEPNEPAAVQIGRMADRFAVENGFRREPAYINMPTDQPSFSKLRSALRQNDAVRATRLLDALRETRSEKDIQEAMLRWKNMPWTRNQNAEQQFMGSLTDAQREVLGRAVDDRFLTYQRFQDLLMAQPSVQRPAPSERDAFGGVLVER